MQDVNMYHLIKFYAKNWAIIALLVGFGILSGFVYNTFIQTPLYKSDATLLLIRKSDTTQNVTLINNYVELFKSRRVLEPVIAKQNLNISYDNLVKSIEATSDKDTEVVKVAISTNNANTSKTFIDGAIASFKEQVAQLYSTDNVQIVDNASLADKPYNVHKEVILALSGAAGFIIAVIALFFAFDFKLDKNKKDKEPTDQDNNKTTDETMKSETTVYSFNNAPIDQNPTVITSQARTQWLNSLYSIERQPKR